MTTYSFDRALIAAAFEIAATQGWRKVSVAQAARQADLDLQQARARFPTRTTILLRLGHLVDQETLTEISTEPSIRDRLFDLLMRRFDALQEYRPGIIALMRGLPLDPIAAVVLSAATLHSMGKMLDAAGVTPYSLGGYLRAKGLTAVWLQATRAWERDDSPDLSATMSALDKALERAERMAQRLPGYKPESVADSEQEPESDFDSDSEPSPTI